MNRFYIVPETKDAPPSEGNRVGTREGQWWNRICSDFSAVYNRVGVKLLMGLKECGFILTDENGKGEDATIAFQKAVLKLLDGGTPIIGVARGLPEVLPNIIYCSPDVNDMIAAIENWVDVLSKMLKGGYGISF